MHNLASKNSNREPNWKNVWHDSKYLMHIKVNTEAWTAGSWEELHPCNETHYGNLNGWWKESAIMAQPFRDGGGYHCTAMQRWTRWHQQGSSCRPICVKKSGYMLTFSWNAYRVLGRMTAHLWSHRIRGRSRGSQDHSQSEHTRKLSQERKGIGREGEKKTDGREEEKE